MLTKAKKKELEDDMLVTLKKTFSPPKNIHKLSSWFITWCKKKKLDPKKQTMNGKNFQKFLRETNSNCRKILQRAKILVSLLKFESPLPMGSESAYESFYNDGWNDCIMAAIKGGKMPAEEGKSEIPFKRAAQDGWNGAIKELRLRQPNLLVEK